MALPVINAVPHYTTKLPSTGEEVRFRPFLVKEQKILLLALETRDLKQIVGAINDILKSCMPDLNIRKLATFDMEYLFLQLRGKSVGENIEAEMSCSECKEPNKIKVNVDEVKMEVKPNMGERSVKLNDQYTLTLKYPSYDYVIRASEGIKTETEMLYTLILGSLNTLKTKDEVINLLDETKEELEKFLDSMNTKQFEDIAVFIREIPKLSHVVKFDCTKCNHHNEVKMEGIADFFL